MTEANQGHAAPLQKKSEATDFNSVTVFTDRLILTPITMDFAEVIFREFTPEITRYMFPKSASDLGETEAFIGDAIAQRERGADLILVILERISSGFLGVCGLHSRTDPSEPELGIWLAKGAHGNRYGREAIHGLVEWTKQNLEVTGFVYPVDRANVASRRIAESLGGVVIEEKATLTMRGTTLDTLVYRIPVLV